MLYNTKENYGIMAKGLHWVIALAMIVIVLLGFSIINAKVLAPYLPQLPSSRGFLMGIHKSLGLSILMVMIFRAIWRINNPTPGYPESMPKWQQNLAHWVHYLLYFLVFSIIFVGWGMSASGGHTTYFWNLFNITLPLPINKNLEHLGEETHLILAWVIIAFFIIHVGAALWHQFVKKDNILKRMWF